MEFDTIGDNLIVMHSYSGVFEVDLKTGEKKQLVSEKDVIGDEVRQFLVCTIRNYFHDFSIRMRDHANFSILLPSRKTETSTFRIQHPTTELTASD